MAEQEDELQIVTTLKNADFIRAIAEGISSRISLSNLATVLSSLITTTDNQNTIRTETTNTSLQDTDEVLVMDCTAGNRAVLLMDAADVFSNNVGQCFWVKRGDKTAGNDCQVNTTGGQLIDGDANWILSGSASEQVWVKLQSIGTGWLVTG